MPFLDISGPMQVRWDRWVGFPDSGDSFGGSNVVGASGSNFERRWKEVSWPHEPNHEEFEIYPHVHRSVIEPDPRHPSLLPPRRAAGLYRRSFAFGHAAPRLVQRSAAVG